MPDHPTPDLTTLQAVCAKATPGEWSLTHIHTDYYDVYDPQTMLCIARVGSSHTTEERDGPNATFIATFNPVLIARLLAVVEALEACTVEQDGRRYYVTANGIPQEMPARLERLVRTALTALGGQDG